MQKHELTYHHPLDPDRIDRIKEELSKLDRQLVDADGVQLKPSQCYHFGTEPLHVLFNTNCPDELREKVEGIISRHLSHQ